MIDPPEEHQREKWQEKINERGGMDYVLEEYNKLSNKQQDLVDKRSGVGEIKRDMENVKHAWEVYVRLSSEVADLESKHEEAKKRSSEAERKYKESRAKQPKQKIQYPTMADMPKTFTDNPRYRKQMETFVNHISTFKDADPRAMKLMTSLGKIVGSSRIKMIFARVDKNSGYSAYNEIKVPDFKGGNLNGKVSTWIHELTHSCDRMLANSGAGVFVSAKNTELMSLISARDDAVGEKAQEKLNELKDIYNNKEFIQVKNETTAKLVADEWDSKGYKEKFGVDMEKYFRTASSKEFFKITKLMEEDEEFKGIYLGLLEKQENIEKELKGKELYWMREQLNGLDMFSDMYDALSGGYGRENKRLVYGHGVKYYSDVRNRPIELIANYVTLSITRPDLIEIFREDKPKVAEYLDGILEDYMGRIDLL